MGSTSDNDVDGPFSAYSEAQIIDKHALEATDGKTYARPASPTTGGAGRGSDDFSPDQESNGREAG